MREIGITPEQAEASQIRQGVSLVYFDDQCVITLQKQIIQVLSLVQIMGWRKGC
jgi:hypothetical protein